MSPSFFCLFDLSLDEGCGERLGKLNIFQVLLSKLRRNIGHQKPAAATLV